MRAMDRDRSGVHPRARAPRAEARERDLPASVPGMVLVGVVVLALAAVLLAASHPAWGLALGALGVLELAGAVAVLLARSLRPPAPAPAGEPFSPAIVHQQALRAGGGAYLATGSKGEWIAAPPQSAVLVLAGPRAGKTSCVVIPALIAHPGAAVATSTKPEVLHATLAARRELGEAWFFDLSGHGTPAGCKPCAGHRFSTRPIGSGRSWSPRR